MWILSTSWEWLIYELDTLGNLWIEKSFCLFVYFIPEAALVLNSAFWDTSPPHSDNQMNINYNNANNLWQ